MDDSPKLTLYERKSAYLLLENNFIAIKMLALMRCIESYSTAPQLSISSKSSEVLQWLFRVRYIGEDFNLQIAAQEIAITIQNGYKVEANLYHNS